MLKHLKGEAQTAVFKDPVRNPQPAPFISVIKTNQFMLYGAQVTVCSEINTKQINTVWADCQFLSVNLFVHLTSKL
jgi:hypothetical protein